ncbi:MAG: thioredoxin-disulfide reductase [Hyphomicrobiales bacterium]
MMPTHAKLAILGSGPAGYTAAIYAARAMLSPLLIQGVQPGGQLTITTEVENYPGFAEPIQGRWLMEQMCAQAKSVGAGIISGHIIKADLSHRPFTLTADDGAVYRCDALVIATGAQAKWLGVPGETAFMGSGVSACATCDGFFFRDRKVVVVGGGNTAVEEALFLANLASQVTLVHRRDTLRADKILQRRLFANNKITILWDRVVEKIVGTNNPKGVTGVRLRHVKNAKGDAIAADGVFVAIGHEPATQLFSGQLAMRAGGYLETAVGSTATNIPGVFAAGDVIDSTYRQAVTAAAMGCMSALEAERFLAAQAGFGS